MTRLLLKSFDAFDVFIGGAAGRRGGVVLLGGMGHHMLLQMRLLRKELEAKLTLIRTFAQMDLLVAQEIGLTAEELVALAAVEGGAFALLTRAAGGGAGGFGFLGFFLSFAGLDVGGSRGGGNHFRRRGKGFLLMVMRLLLRWLRLNLLMLELLLLLLLMMLLLLLLLDLYGLHFLATFRRG